MVWDLLHYQPGFCQWIKKVKGLSKQRIERLLSGLYSVSIANYKCWQNVGTLKTLALNTICLDKLVLVLQEPCRCLQEWLWLIEVYWKSYLGQVLANELFQNLPKIYLLTHVSESRQFFSYGFFIVDFVLDKDLIFKQLFYYRILYVNFLCDFWEGLFRLLVLQYKALLLNCQLGFVLIKWQELLVTCRLSGRQVLKLIGIIDRDFWKEILVEILLRILSIILLETDLCFLLDNSAYLVDDLIFSVEFLA